ncbi:hypothetical protein EUBC25_28020 [Claveliimonas bilis]|uniref:RND related barrel-sandwich hybrid domain-containing protein n=1 Tax=Claveliimonas bilis TaxID=3028070 RepID=A0ABN6YW55_9FIRM|nr:HlyD family efflux transporter periplasmic adaptor subunit [Claveliimonas bilis]BCZ28715.1 hypothetical protein EUBC25_28020 [Claveliimonas bilis]BDZ77554.1 hypothetical protein Lac1_17370 [Claveliimonas bilis]BDZ81594.1 hypothetical protein Lac3_28030 [Claveliimonas bilis]
MTGNEINNIQVYRKKWNINIGVIIFGVIFVYLVVTVLMYATAKHVSSYEVREGSILKDTSYTGLVLREETVIGAEADGYINYFAPEGSKVGRKTNVYSISSEKLDFSGQENTEESEDSGLTSEERDSIIQKAQSFSENFQNNKYEDTYTFKDSIENILSSSTAQSRQAQLSAMIESGQEGLTTYVASDDGIIVYSVDGYEDLAMDQVTADMISRADYQKTELFNNTKVKSGDPAYKLVTNEEWTLVIQLDEEMTKELADTTSVKVRFTKDDQTTWAGFQIYNTEDADLGFLTFDHSMVRYVGERFLDIELILEDETGLKIPKSSVTEKEFYIIPEDYITLGGNSSQSGVLVQSDGEDASFHAVDVYYRDSETGMVYLNMDELKKGDVLIKPDSADTYTISEKASLQGVYNINKGYAEFKPVEILCESEEYYIVKSGNDYGLTNYDHIALDGSEIQENELVM